jgi:hypothetical protein
MKSFSANARYELEIQFQEYITPRITWFHESLHRLVSGSVTIHREKAGEPPSELGRTVRFHLHGAMNKTQKSCYPKWT